MRCPVQGDTGGCVMLGLVFKWFPLCEFSLYDTPPYLPMMYSNTVLISGPATQILISSYSCVFFLLIFTAIKLVHLLLWALSIFLYIPYIQSLPSWLCGFNLKFVRLVGMFWVFFLSHTAPGFLLWFCFFPPLHVGLSPGVFLLRLPWRTWICPSGGQVWRWCSCLGRGGSGSTGYSGPLATKEAGNTVL